MGEALTRRLDDGRTLGFGNNPIANLSDLHQRMPFVLKAATQFDELLHDGNRHQIEQAILGQTTLSNP